MVEQHSIIDLTQQPTDITFRDHEKQVGKLIMEAGTMRFEGDVEESAKVFFDWLIKLWEKPCCTGPAFQSEGITVMDASSDKGPQLVRVCTREE